MRNESLCWNAEFKWNVNFFHLPRKINRENYSIWTLLLDACRSLFFLCVCDEWTNWVRNVWNVGIPAHTPPTATTVLEYFQLTFLLFLRENARTRKLTVCFRWITLPRNSLLVSDSSCPFRDVRSLNRRAAVLLTINRFVVYDERYCFWGHNVRGVHLSSLLLIDSEQSRFGITKNSHSFKLKIRSFCLERVADLR